MERLADGGSLHVRATRDEYVADEGGREEALGGDPRIGLQARRQRRRIVEAGAAVVGDQTTVGAVRPSRAQGDVGAEAGEGGGEAEGEELQRDRAGEALDRLRGVGDDDEALGRRGDDLLPQVGAAAALDQPAVRGDLVGAVDREVEPAEAVEVLDRDAERARLVFGRRRGRHAAQFGEAATGYGGQQVGDGRAGAEAERHAALDQLRGGFGRDSLLVVGGHCPATLFGYPDRPRPHNGPTRPQIESRSQNTEMTVTPTQDYKVADI